MGVRLSQQGFAGLRQACISGRRGVRVRSRGCICTRGPALPEALCCLLRGLPLRVAVVEVHVGPRTWPGLACTP